MNKSKIENNQPEQMLNSIPKVDVHSSASHIGNNMLVAGSFLGNCADNVHWYVGRYSQGFWIYNICSYCGKRQIV